MSTWGPRAIAGYARDAGFRGDALHDAVALALAASGGADHYRHNPISAPGAERRGLWALRVDEVPAELGLDLFGAADNARALRYLWDASTQSFGFHPTWIIGHAAPLGPMVRASLSGHGVAPGLTASLPYSDYLVHIVARAQAFGQTLDTGQMPHA